MISKDEPDQQWRPAGAADPRRHIYTDGVHLVVDGDRPKDLLHQFARRISLKPEWFQQDEAGGHYDLTTPLAAQRAVMAGATLVEIRDVAVLRHPTGHAKRPEGYVPTVLGQGAPAYRLAAQKHGDTMEWIQGPGEREWHRRNRNRAAADHRDANGVARKQRVIRI